MSKSFEQLVGLYRRVHFKGCTPYGSLLLENQSDCDLLDALLDEQDVYGLSVEDGEISPSSTVHLRFGPPRISLGLLFPDYASLLSTHKRQSSEPENYFIIESKFFSKDADVPEEVINYRLIIRFIDLLKECAAYFDSTASEFVFFNTDVFKLPVRYGAIHIKELDNASLQELIDCFVEETHREQKLDILIKSIQIVSEGITAEEKFSNLLSKTLLLKQQFLKGFRVFASGFSYDKVMDQLRAAKVEEIGKIHKTFSDIQNHVLGIPVATVIVATQMKKADGWGDQMIINSAVLAGCFIFVCLIALVLLNQVQSLKAIREELAYKKKQIEKDYSSIKNDIDGVFKSIEKRLLVQKVAFIFIRVVLGIGLLLAFLTYAYQTTPVWNYLTAHFSFFNFLANAIQKI